MVRGTAPAEAAWINDASARSSCGTECAALERARTAPELLFPGWAGQTAMPRVPSMPRLNTSARLQTSLRLPSRTRGKHRRLRELLDAEDEDRTVVQS